MLYAPASLFVAENGVLDEVEKSYKRWGGRKVEIREKEVFEVLQTALFYTQATGHSE